MASYRPSGLFAAVAVVLALPAGAGSTRDVATMDNSRPGLVGRQQVARRSLSPVNLPNLDQMPLYFIENRGQLDPLVRFYLQGRDNRFYFTNRGLTLVLSNLANWSRNAPGLNKASLAIGKAAPTDRWVTKLEFVGANRNVSIQGGEKSPAVISYFRGPREKWKTGLATYGSIVYSDLWPGIDLVYSGTSDRLKYTFEIKPGADTRAIQLAYRGVEDIRIDAQNRLVVETPGGILLDDAPEEYP